MRLEEFRPAAREHDIVRAQDVIGQVRIACIRRVLAAFQMRAVRVQGNEGKDEGRNAEEDGRAGCEG